MHKSVAIRRGRPRLGATASLLLCVCVAVVILSVCLSCMTTVTANTTCLGEYQQCSTGDCVLDPSQCGKCQGGQYICPLEVNNVTHCVSGAAGYLECPGLVGTHLDWKLNIESRLDYLVNTTSIQDQIKQLTNSAPSIVSQGIPVSSNIYNNSSSTHHPWCCVADNVTDSVLTINMIQIILTHIFTCVIWSLCVFVFALQFSSSLLFSPLLSSSMILCRHTTIWLMMNMVSNAIMLLLSQMDVLLDLRLIRTCCIKSALPLHVKLVAIIILLYMQEIVLLCKMVLVSHFMHQISIWYEILVGVEHKRCMARILL
jgi:hypothetical protein